ncbi:hypothetical protein Q1695_004978 [Nippostrongylus brasiliensis]|nr:hypothetical protein Q1695_004978 [Nippostrongylus brasiliensis]
MTVSRFVPVALGTWEIRLCWLVWIFHSGAAFFMAYHLSQGPMKQSLRLWLTNSSYVEGAQMDLSDPEWSHFRQTVLHNLFNYSIHSATFYLIIRFFTPDMAKIMLVLVGAALHVHLSSLYCVLVLSAFAVVVVSLSVLTRHIAVPWILCVAFLLKSMDVIPLTQENIVYYREFHVYLYGAIKVLNFSLYMCRNKETAYREVWREHLVYSAYIPFTMTLIVLFDDFVEQLKRRLSDRTGSSLDLKFSGFFAVRIAFWYFAFEFIIHFIHVHSIYNIPLSIIDRLSNFEIAAVSYVVGQMFFLKYVVLFGFPALFAYIDGMRPPAPPICISRVSLYSRMWRHFDVGLYQFLKNQVYIPLLNVPMHPVLGKLRFCLTLTAVFSVVLCWHGTQSQYVVWVLLSAGELIIEKIGGLLWRTEQFQEFRRCIGEKNTRRVVAVAMLMTVVPGILGTFYFLGVEGIGSVVLRRLLLDAFKDWFNGNVVISSNCAGWVLIHLLTLGYFFNHVCLELDKRKVHDKSDVKSHKE